VIYEPTEYTVYKENRIVQNLCIIRGAKTIREIESSWYTYPSVCWNTGPYHIWI